MALLKHDSAGFLVGELLDVERDLLKVHQQGLSIWRGVRTDVAAIALVMGVSRRASRSPAAVAAQRAGGQCAAIRSAVGAARAGRGNRRTPQ